MYDQDPEHRQEKVKQQTIYEKEKYDQDPEHRQEKIKKQTEQKKEKYDQDPQHRQEKLKKQTEKYEQDPKHREEKLKQHRQYEKEKYHKDIDYREQRKEARMLFYYSNKIRNLLDKEHSSGMEYMCCSCTRLRSRDQAGIWKEGKQNVDKKLFISLFTQSFDGNSYVCTTCRPALRRGVPKINMLAIDDFNTIGSIPYSLPNLNLMEEYLIKLTIPFIRVVHMPRSPNLKLMGGSVCIQADIAHTVDRLNINPETIIPVSFKRKLQYEGHYMAQVINKKHVFLWLEHLKKYNHLYKDVIIFTESELDTQLEKYEDTLLKELADFDDKRMSKESRDAKDLNDLEEKYENMQVSDEIFDSEEDDSDSGEDAVAEVLNDIEIHENDTFLYPVNEISLEEKTIPNKIAKLIVYGEKLNKEAFELQDEFAPEFENFLFKDNDEEDDVNVDLDEDILKEMEKSFDFEDNTGNVLINSDVSDKETENDSTTKEKKKKKPIKGKKKERATVVAPGEGQSFENEYKYQEEKCFPNLFPTGKGGYSSTYMEMGLGFSNYCKLRLTGGLCLKNTCLAEEIVQMEKNSRIDYERFRGNHHYMMFLLLILDAINMRRAQTTAFRKVTRLQKYKVNSTKITNADKELLERHNIGYRTFKNIRGTAPYFELQKTRLFAFLRQIGPPTIFTTITSAEFDWCDLMVNIIRGIPDVKEIQKIVGNMRRKDKLEFLHDLENVEDIKKYAYDIVTNMEGPEMSKLVNEHIVHTTVDFDQRIKFLFKLLKIPGNILMYKWMNF